MRYLFFLLLFSVNQLIYAQASGNSNYKRGNENNIHSNNVGTFVGDSVFIIETNVLMNLEADQFVAIFGLHQFSEKLSTVFEQLEIRRKGFYTDLVKNDVDTNKIHCDFISQVPVFGFIQEKRIFSQTNNEVPIGFELQENLHIQLNSERKIATLMQLAAKWEIYDFIKLEYIATNTKAVYDTLRKVSLSIIDSKMQSLKQNGMKINIKYQVFTENLHTTYPEDRYFQYTAFQNDDVPTSSKKSTSNFTRKQTTIYYNKLDYDNYELIINPVVLKPVVQFSYNLRMKFTLIKQ